MKPFIREKHINQPQDVKKALLNVMADLRETNVKNEAILASIADGVVIVDKSGVIILINHSAEKLLNCKADCSIGKKWSQVLKLEDKSGNIIPKEASPITIALKGGVPSTYASDEDIFYYTRKDGTKFIASNTISPIVLEKKIIGAIDIFRDITEHQKLKKNLSMFSKAVENAYDSFLLTDMKGNFTYANAPALRLFGYSLKELTKMHVSQFSADPKDALMIFETVQKNGYWSGELISIKKNKETFPIRLSTSLVKDDLGNPVGTMGVLRNISHEKELDKMKDQFMDIAAHDLRTPAAAIRGFISRVLDGDAGTISDKARELLSLAYEGNLRLIKLVDDFLDVSRLERGKIKIMPKACDLEKIVEISLSIFSGLAKSTDLTFEYKKVKLPIVLADEQRTIQVITNLLENSFKFTERGGIVIDHRIDNGKVVTSITDTGIGMPPNTLKKNYSRNITKAMRRPTGVV